jgi:hypothetical protein
LLPLADEINGFDKSFDFHSWLQPEWLHSIQSNHVESAFPLSDYLWVSPIALIKNIVLAIISKEEDIILGYWVAVVFESLIPVDDDRPARIVYAN